MRISSPTKPVLLGTLAGVGLGAGALTLWRPASAARTPCRTEACATERLQKAIEAGLPDQGSLRVEDPMSVRMREFAHDPGAPDVVQVRFPELPGRLLVSTAPDILRRLLGSIERFQEGYALARDPELVSTEPEPAFLQEYRKRGCDGCVIRRFWIGSESLRILRVEDRTSDGRVFFSVQVRAGPLTGWHPKSGVPLAVRPARPAVPGSKEAVDFETFVESLPFPVYEPGELPPHFARVEYGFDSKPPVRDEAPLPIAWIGYTDGVVRMNLFVTNPEQMRRLEDLARRSDAAPGSNVCPTSLASTPEELIEDGPGTVLVRRRADGCRTVLRRDDLEGVVVALVGYPGLHPEDYVRTIKSLVRVGPRTKPGERALAPVESDPDMKDR